jgi:hypothetical protein
VCFISGYISQDLFFKQKRGPWQRYNYAPGILERAVEDVKAGKMNTYQAARYYNIPRSTIANKIYKKFK